jgi:kinesin family member 5
MILTDSLQSKEASGAFTFDRVFDMNSRQDDVFEYSIRSTVDDVMNGYNGTVFAYGQTGAGKSYTMMGSDIDNNELKGIIPRIVEQIFASIMDSPSTIEYIVRVSYMEIYMERIRDLLMPQNDNLPIHEEKNRGVYVKGLLEIFVSNVQEVYEVMRRGASSRAVAATNMNQESSRSHSIFVINIQQKNVETGSAKSGQLFLVDLAGSEKVGKTGASGQTLEEAKKINKSLSALGMVINSLTDGKSTHIPYRDSKLTRILQESLGGNSRTTLIINCSPSSYNDAETVSTLRFGVRAKAIKNKAKINAELSPAELRQLLKKAQTQVTTFENYIKTVEGELQLWRRGETVPRERWVPSMDGDAMKTRPDLKAPRPETPSRPISDISRSDTPILRPDSRMGDRSSTPSVVLDKDERDEFLRRENELQDQLAEKETAFASAEKSFQETKAELQYLKDNATRTGKDNEKLNTEVNELRMQLEKISFESKEAGITMDSLKEANSELTTELDDVKQQLLDVKMSAKETTAVLDEKERKKAERMAKMMAGFDLGGEVFSDNERKIQNLIEDVDGLHQASEAGIVLPPEEFKILRSRLLETQGFVRQAEIHMNDKSEVTEMQDSHRQELESRLLELERDYQEALEKKLSDEDVQDVKSRLEKAYSAHQDHQSSLVSDLRDELTRSIEDNNRLKSSLEALRQTSKTIPNGAPTANGSPSQPKLKIVQQLAEFDTMKKSLMRDLQNRCERVVELEISLDETREQYNNVLRSSNNRAQQKKMAFLERNLEQLTHVQRQLVEQNGSLKKEVAIAERKLIARNERIGSLEALLQDSQEKLTTANHRYYIPTSNPNLTPKSKSRLTSVSDSFESQLTAVKERLEAVKMGSRGGQAYAPIAGNQGFGGFNFGGTGSRIAKPLRGGGGGAEPATMNGGTGPSLPILSGLQNEGGNAGGNKRSSWFFDRR